MSLHLDVVCESHVPAKECRSQSVRVIAEVLPFVLAKYGISALSVRCSEDQTSPRGFGPRFKIG